MITLNAPPARKPVALLLVALLALTRAVSAQTGAVDLSDPRLNQGPKTVAIGDKGMVSTQLLSSTEAALRVSLLVSVAAALAGTFPGRRVAKMDVKEALSYE